MIISCGWYLRADIIWQKTNAKPESVTDRPTITHEYIFLLSKHKKYYYDQDAIREPYKTDSIARLATGADSTHNNSATFKRNGSKRESPIFEQGYGTHRPNRKGPSYHPLGRNKTNIWPVSVKPFYGAHTAVFPPDLIEPCILAGCPPGGIVLDPFFGSGTTGEVCEKNGRFYLGVELSRKSVALAKDRVGGG